MRSCSIVQDAIAIVHATGDQGVDKHSGVVSRERWAYGPELTKVVETSRSNPLHVRRKCQFGVSVDAKTCDSVRYGEAAVFEWHLDHVDDAELLSRADPHELCLVGVKLEAV